MKKLENIPILLRYFFSLGFVFFFILNERSADAQIDDSGYAFVASIPQLTTYPPLSADMSIDVRTGYIYLDSIRRHYTRQMDRVIAHLTYSDTMRHALKYLYELDNYSPLLFEQYCESSPSPFYYQSSGTLLRVKLMKRATSIFPDWQHIEMISSASIIAHIHVTGIDSIFNRSSIAYPNQRVVSCEIVDTIKGRHLPSCGDTFGSQRGISPQALSNCLRFCYSPQEPLRGSKGDVSFGDPTMTDSLGNPWVKVGADYIAFLSIYFVGSDSINLYYTITPLKHHTTQGSLYSVNSGHVSDPNNDMGFGVYPTLSDFVAGLRSKIYSITHP
ncbi:MAG: hypothetical protein Q8916_07190 [Bacteroidota bacterium]|nr:hypothetical protein [Bacteroidota bacterium]MDP4230176.1 hypothetical protein [Bacteroidota bacterium]MDP4237759.1 hypothetical protein [Bacteroidota bacterium]